MEDDKAKNISDVLFNSTEEDFNNAYNPDEGLHVTPAFFEALLSGVGADILAAGTPGGIEAQEAQGQVDFVEAQTLPIDCPRRELETIGFIFGENVDDIFVTVKFPEGWTKEATDHSMWSDLKDQDGNLRGSMFYKAAFYDRSSHMSLLPKIDYSQVYAKADQHEMFVQYRVFERTGGETKTLFVTDRMDCEKHSDEYFHMVDVYSNVAREWVEENYPDFQDKTAYWGDLD